MPPISFMTQATTLGRRYLGHPRRPVTSEPIRTNSRSRISSPREDGERVGGYVGSSVCHPERCCVGHSGHADLSVPKVGSHHCRSAIRWESFGSPHPTQLFDVG